MPTVPRRQDSQIELRAIPGVSPAEAPSAAFGGGPAGAAPFQAAQDLTGEAKKFALQARNEADDIVITDGTNQLHKTKQAALDSVKLAKGPSVYDAVAKAVNDFESHQQELVKKMTPRQRDLFNMRAGGVHSDLVATANSMASQETERFRLETIAEESSARVNDARLHANNDLKIAEILDAADARVADESQRLYGTKTVTDPVKLKHLAEVRTSLTSPIHMAVIDARAEAGDYTGAESYFKEMRKTGEMTAKDQETAERVVKRATIERKSQEMVDRVNARGLTGEDAIRKIDSEFADEPEVRKAAKALWLEDQNQKQAARRLEDSANLDHAMQYVSRGVPVPPSVMGRLDKDTQGKVELLARDRVTDNFKLADWESMKVSDKAALSKDQLFMEYLPYFSENDRRRIIGEWGSLKSGEKRAMQQAESIYTDNQMVLNSLKSVKLLDQFDTEETINKSREEGKRQLIDSVKNEYNRRVFALGEKVTDQAKEAILRDITRQVVALRVDWWKDPKMLRSMVTESDRERMYVPDIPAQDATRLFNLAKSAGLNLGETPGKAMRNDKALLVISDAYMRTKWDGYSDQQIYDHFKTISEKIRAKKAR